MRCLSCGAEMNLTQAAPDATMMVPGYEDQTLECPSCHEVERRRVFRNETAPPAVEPGPVNLVPAETLPVGAASAAALVAEGIAMHSAPASVVPGPAAEIDEAEELLRRAIAMVKAPVGGSQPLKGLTDDLRRPAAPVSSMPAQKSATGRVVQIRHDPSYEAAFAAKDAKTGLVVLRHRDSTRLRSMCERLGWQVVEDGAAGAED